MTSRAATSMIITLICLTGIILSTTATWAVDPAAQMKAAWQEAEKALKKGPVEIPIAGQATLKLPKGFGYIPVGQTQRLLTAMGNTSQPNIQGMLVPLGSGEEENWFMVITYNDSGYISDEDAKDWDHDELLESYRAGTEEGNSVRSQRGLPEWEVGGWVEKPSYDAQNRRLIWAISLRDKGVTSAEETSVNYNTLALGREGYISMILVTGLNEVEAQKPAAKTLLSSLTFNPGRQYTDFDSSADKVAGYGLAALVTGVAAKKLGLIAMIAAFVAKFAKVIIVAALVFGAVARRFFTGKKDDENSLEVKHD